MPAPPALASADLGQTQRISLGSASSLHLVGNLATPQTALKVLVFVSMLSGCALVGLSLSLSGRGARGRLAIWRLVLVGLVAGGLAVVPGTVGALEPVGGGGSAVGAPALWCTSSQRVSVSHPGTQQWSPEAFVGVWVPAGTRLMATVEGRVHTQFGYSGNHGE